MPTPTNKYQLYLLKFELSLANTNSLWQNANIPTRSDKTPKQYGKMTTQQGKMPKSKVEYEYKPVKR